MCKYKRKGTLFIGESALENKSERGRGEIMERLLETRSILANATPCGMLLEGRLKSDGMGDIWE